MATFYIAIVKFILALELNLSKPQHEHLLAMAHGIVLCAGRKNITQIRSAAGHDRHLSSVTGFLNHSPWSPNRMQRRRMHFVMERIRKAHVRQGDLRPIMFIIVDDTYSKKDKSTKRMEALDFHYSQDDDKSVWSHFVVTVHVVSEGNSQAWDFRPVFS